MDLEINDENNMIAAKCVETIVHPTCLKGMIVTLLGNDQLSFELEMTEDNARRLAVGIFEALRDGDKLERL